MTEDIKKACEVMAAGGIILYPTDTIWGIGCDATNEKAVCSDQDGTQERLDILNRSNDGFYIASEDLKLRGPGDFFGLRQSGDMEFKIADIFTDANLLKTVSEEVNRILERDPNLEQEEYWALRERLDVYLSKSYDKLNL